MSVAKTFRDVGLNMKNIQNYWLSGKIYKIY